MTVGVERGNADLLTDLCFAQRQTSGGSTADGIPTGTVGRTLPLVVDGAETVGIGQGVGRGQRLALCGGTAHCHGAGWHVIDVGNRSRRYAGRRFEGAAPVDVRTGNTHLPADLRFGQREATGGGAGYVRPTGAIGRRLPLVGDCSQTVDVGQRIGCSQRLVLGGDAAHRHPTGWCVIHPRGLVDDGRKVPGIAIGKLDELNGVVGIDGEISVEEVRQRDLVVGPGD